MEEKQRDLLIRLDEKMSIVITKINVLESKIETYEKSCISCKLELSKTISKKCPWSAMITAGSLALTGISWVIILFIEHINTAVAVIEASPK